MRSNNNNKAGNFFSSSSFQQSSYFRSLSRKSRFTSRARSTSDLKKKKSVYLRKNRKCSTKPYTSTWCSLSRKAAFNVILFSFSLFASRDLCTKMPSAMENSETKKRYSFSPLCCRVVLQPPLPVLFVLALIWDGPPRPPPLGAGGGGRGRGRRLQGHWRVGKEGAWTKNNIFILIREYTR